MTWKSTNLFVLKCSFHWWKAFCSIYNSPGWRLRDIQRWSALIQNTFRSVSALFITWKSLKSADSALNSAENENFLVEKSTLNSADLLLILSETALSFSVLNSADSEKIKTDQLWNSWSALRFFMFSESALKNVKFLKKRCSSLTISGNSTRVKKCPLLDKNWSSFQNLFVITPLSWTKNCLQRKIRKLFDLLSLLGSV